MTSYFLEGKQSIPLTLEDVRALLEDGCLQANDRLRRESEQTFLCIREFPELIQGPRTDSVSIPPPHPNSPSLPPPRTGSVSLAPPAAFAPAQAPTQPPPRPVRQPDPMAVLMPEKRNVPARSRPQTAGDSAHPSPPPVQATAFLAPPAAPVVITLLPQQPSSPSVSVVSTPGPRKPSSQSVPVTMDAAPGHRRRSNWTLLAVGVAALLCVAALVALIARRGTKAAPPVAPTLRPAAHEAFTPPPAATPTTEQDIVPTQTGPSLPTKPKTADAVHGHRKRAARAEKTVEMPEREKESPPRNQPLSSTPSKTGDIPPRLAAPPP
jgi:hypothetical protein